MALLAGHSERNLRQKAMDWLLDPGWGGLESESRVQVALDRVVLERDPELAGAWRVALATWDSERARRWVEGEIARAPVPQAMELVSALQANPRTGALIRRLAGRLVDPAPEHALPVPVAAELLPLYGRILVDSVPGDLVPADVAPLVAG
ncbi:MAG: hypothetical protein P1V35_08650, partial [Planctomycetota bacterium]|nr:hypothetical protein [Planctomycetota bacterium]